MDNREKLHAPRPVKVNPFLRTGASKVSHFDRRLQYSQYRNSDRVKSENLNVFSKICPFNDNLLDSDEIEKEFSEIDAKSEIFSILHNDSSFSSSFLHRDSAASNITFDFCEVAEDKTDCTVKKFDTKSNIRS